MIRKDLFAGAAGVATAVALGAVAGGSVAFASQDSSDADMFGVRGRILGMINQLDNLKGDYNGNRANTIHSLVAAQDAVDHAVAIRGANQAVSDSVMRTVGAEIAEMLGRLRADAGDYNGHKDTAIKKLTDAQNYVNAALRTA